jgi:hypothetical protein
MGLGLVQHNANSVKSTERRDAAPRVHALVILSERWGMVQHDAAPRVHAFVILSERWGMVQHDAAPMVQHDAAPMVQHDAAPRVADVAQEGPPTEQHHAAPQGAGGRGTLNTIKSRIMTRVRVILHIVVGVHSLRCSPGAPRGGPAGSLRGIGRGVHQEPGEVQQAETERRVCV